MSDFESSHGNGPGFTAPAILNLAAGGLEPLAAPRVRSARLAALAPRTISLALKRPKVKTFSHAFSGAGASVFFQPADKKGTKPGAASSSGNKKESGSPDQYTRIKPPRDIVKLEDRLFYVLQPPLESWMAGAQMDFPFKPFPYQFEGIAFMYPRYACLLADEMGLGKTMQTITAIRLLLRSAELKQVLLICPKPLVNNWQREFATWAPEIPILAIEGDQTKRRWQWQLSDMPVKIANYELLIRDRDVITEPSMEFDLVVLDEAQRIKNKSGTTSQIVRSIKRKRSWALTGTPVENRAEDLVGIFEFLAPGYLCPQMKPRQMGQLAGEFVLRRTKDKVLTDLPPKMYRDAHIELTPEQRESYRMAEEDGIVRLEKMGKEITIQHVFELVLRLKQICNFDPPTGESAKLERMAADLEEVAASGKKAIIFSQWVDTILELSKRLKQYKPLEYHGKIPHKDRPGILDRFKADPTRNVLLLSYGAGGVGLNLQFSEYVFLFDRWWNPALEDQAINRAHRIGAAGPVTVTRFLATNTIEERIDQILTEKRELFDTILNSSEPPTRNLGLSKAEVFGLFKLKCPAGAIDPSK